MTTGRSGGWRFAATTRITPITAAASAAAAISTARGGPSDSPVTCAATSLLSYTGAVRSRRQ
ncbi:Uncharacterised protein [Mycobacterium tuberculosis]|uniref:Uncharacterized protein n=1 Tax=Mycobacterium tuberculosis TaxID=1773 RepID=A0A654ZZR3_MYCTX|nr:Uncharacterised protein [Mycobacterium tuberculosis]CFS13913.1 Uncharacterised protein [Mycobacterium tuberculosis]CKP97999.1 Uncharacterised protein [Mycobacterium tuberculosis]CKR83312.1 Uncharacterised protein [Mycobacterium tuberculosis]CNV29153.1 Uncharacterised protein [Mycobacterium tuberculosis]